MKPKKAKNAVRGGGVKDTAEGCVSSVPEVTWEALRSRAEAALDDKGIEAQERRKAAAERISRRMKERGIEPVWDVRGVERALAAYFADYVLGDGRKGFRKVFAECGVSVADFLDARDTHPDLRMVYDYIHRQGAGVASIEALELNRQAQGAQKRLVTEEGCELNQRAVEVSLRATMKDVYGDDGGVGAAKHLRLVLRCDSGAFHRRRIHGRRHVGQDFPRGVPLRIEGAAATEGTDNARDLRSDACG